jgi:predicted CopG family antitoxin
MLRTYEANFSVALYSLGAYEYPFEEEIPYSEIIASHTNNFNWCLCNDIQSNYVLKFLKEGYELFEMADITISDIIYERTGKFTCKIDIFDEIEEPYSDSEIEEIIEESIRPSELIEENGIVINNEKYAVDIKLDYYVETYYDDEDDGQKNEEEEEEEEEKEEINISQSYA